MEVVPHAFAVGVSVYFDLPLYLFFYLHHDSSIAPFGVLQVLLLLGGCLAFLKAGLSTHPV